MTTLSERLTQQGREIPENTESHPDLVFLQCPGHRGNFHAKAGNCYEDWKTHIGSADGAAAQSVADIELYPYSGAMQYAVSVTIG